MFSHRQEFRLIMKTMESKINIDGVLLVITICKYFSVQPPG